MTVRQRSYLISVLFDRGRVSLIADARQTRKRLQCAGDNTEWANEIAVSVSARAEPRAGRQQRKQQRRKTEIRACDGARGCSGGSLRRIPPPWKTLCRGIELEDAQNMLLSKAARC